jgi:DNA sulfur modification protein DndD
LERERRRILDLQARTEQDERRSQLAAGAIAALGTYERQLLQSKLEIVRREFLKCFRHLARKTELVKDVRIDPTSFSVTLIDSADHEMPKAALSAGEKQVYATAMLWALARASGRPLPMLIDTPLARLDSTHRDALLTRYFPTASHQVILLSTDTEIDADAALLLAPSVSHALRLEYDATAGATHVERGYFWPHSESTSDHALLEATSVS